MRDAGIRRDVAVAVTGERIAAVGPLAELEPAFPDATTIDCGGGVLTPGLVDSHTHAIFGRPRADEQEQRAAGADYLAIAARGGGIHASVRDLRASIRGRTGWSGARAAPPARVVRHDHRRGEVRIRADGRG